MRAIIARGDRTIHLRPDTVMEDEDENDPFDPLPPGSRVGNYEIVGLIGRGGMGAVYEAFHVYLRKPVALKVLLGHAARDKIIVQRFMQEGMAASRVGHEGIVDVSDSGTYEGAPYLVMELLQGEALADRVHREGKLAPQMVADVMVPVCSALAAAHAAGVIHRDLKPDNIFLTRTRRGQIVPKLVDFGVSKVTSNAIEDMSLTRTGVLVGTPHYMSPEQATGRLDLDERTDQYAAGVILYECLSGEVPFDGDNYLSVIHAVATERPPPLRAKAPAVPPALDAVVLRALARLRDDRFPSIADLGLALLPFASRSVREAWEQDLITAASAARRHGGPAAGAAPEHDTHDTPISFEPPEMMKTFADDRARVPSFAGDDEKTQARRQLPSIESVPSMHVQLLDDDDDSTTESPAGGSKRVVISPSIGDTNPNARSGEDDDRRTPVLPAAHASAVPQDPAELERKVEDILGVYSSGVRPLPRLDAAGIECLIAAKLIDPDARAGDGPTATDILAFVRRWPAATAHGYVSSRRRDDRYVTLEGIQCDLAGLPVDTLPRLRADFQRFAQGALECRDANMLLYASWG